MPDGALGGLLLVAAILLVFLASTLAFDLVHVALHRCARSRSGVLRAICALHETHHRFMDRNLDIHPEWQALNLRHHVIPEYLTQAGFSLALAALLPLRIVLPVLALQTLVFALILRGRGLDINHHAIASLRAHRPFYFCLPEYHAWHHAQPDAFYSSWIKTLDHLLASGSTLAGRRVFLSGAAMPLGRALRERLAQRAGSLRCSDGAPPAALAAELAQLDVLVLAHEPADDHARWIEDFCRAAAGRKLPPEVWALAPHADAANRAARADAGAATRVARRYFTDPRVVFRLLALDARERDPEASAALALRRIERGFHFVSDQPGLRALAALARFRFGRLQQSR